MKNAPPKLLYKYKKIDEYAKRIFTHNELYFTPFDELNDKNEMFFYYKEDGIQIREKDGVRVADGGDAGKHVCKVLKPRHGVLCLTEKNDDLLMFDYYADGHKGICIEFSWEKFQMVSKANQCLQLPKKVIYSKKPLSLSSSDTQGFNKLFYTKWFEYAHEKEWRFLYKPGVLQNIIVRKAITGIIFGCATSEEDKKCIKNLLKSRNDVSFYQANVENKKYALKITPV